MKTIVPVLAMFAVCVSARAQIFTPPQPTQLYTRSPLLKQVGIDQKLGAEIPLELPFTDETGKTVALGAYFDKPVILALVYFQCPSLCNMVLNGVVNAAKNLDVPYNVVAVSFDPRDTPRIASTKKASYSKELPSAQNWHFLTGTEGATRALADSVGFHYAYDPLTNQYAHGSAIMILSPAGKISRYFYGISYPARDVRLGLIEASNNRVSSPIDQVLLYCYHYDPSTGRYGLVIMNVLRLFAFATVASLAGFMFVMLRRDWHRGAF